MFRTFKSFAFLHICCIALVSSDIPCRPRNEEYESVVCVCTPAYCDEISKIVTQPKGNLIAYSSSKGGLRFKKTAGKLKPYNDANVQSNFDFISEAMKFLNLKPNNDEIVLNVNRYTAYQTIIGFGAAFTDSASINFIKMSKRLRKKLIRSYFSENGLEYNVGRVPIGGTDFSTRPYAYNMKPEHDIKLSNFSLTEEDYFYKIPFIKRAAAANNNLYLMAAAWSPPAWMKTTGKISGIGMLLPEYYQTWADYHLKFLEEYDKMNISFWAISTGNEPINGIQNFLAINSLGWYPDTQGKWIAENFGPTIKGSKKFSNILILTLDDQRFTTPAWLMIMFLNTRAMDYVDGIGIHWYVNNIVPSFFADFTHNLYRDKFIMGTEAATGVYEPYPDKVVPGAWYRAESFIDDLMEGLNHWYVGWLDWNLILDFQGGPNWFYNFADACIIAYPEKDEFIKQPVFYIMGHFSKFIPRDSVRIDLNQISGSSVSNVAFLRPDGGVTVVVYNKYDVEKSITIREKGLGQVSLTVPPQSIHSVVYW